MQVTLGKRGDYSVRAVLYLARHHGTGRRKAREIASEMDIPERYLPQILANLVRHGLLVAVAGPDGGYALSREPVEISLLEVVEAAEGPLVLETCLLRGGPCDWEDACPMHAPWRRAQDALIGHLRDTTFRELADRDRAIEGGDVGEPSGHPKRTVREGVRGAKTAKAPSPRAGTLRARRQ